jgi:hypothetical protein
MQIPPSLDGDVVDQTGVSERTPPEIRGEAEASLDGASGSSDDG